MSSSRVWLITGASSGFGRSLTELVLSKGEKVVAAVRKPASLDDLAPKHSDNLLVVKTDTTVSADVLNVFAAAKARFGRVDVVFNNAGGGFVAEVEGTPEEAARKTFDVNFWGATNVSREAVRFFREENTPQGGRLIITSSMVAISAVPSMGYYSASKAALELVTEALAKEIDPAWNIKISLFQAGPFSTRSTLKELAETAFPLHPAYTNPELPVHGTRSWFSSGAFNDANKAMARIYDLASEEEPLLRFPLSKETLGLTALRNEESSKAVERYAALSENLQQD